MMVITTGRHKGCLIAEAHDLIEPEHVCVKRDRAIDVRHFQMHVANAGAGRNTVGLHAVSLIRRGGRPQDETRIDK